MFERQEQRQSSKRLKSNRALLVERIMDDWSINLKSVEVKKEIDHRSNRSQSSLTEKRSKMSIN